MSAWSEKFGAEALKRWNDGKSASEIANWVSRETGLHISRNAIIGYVHRKLGAASRGSPSAPKPRTPAPRVPQVQRRLQSDTASARNIGRATRSDGTLKSTEAPKPIVEKAVPSAPPPLMIRPIDLETHHCRWPIGDPAEGGFAHCGHRRGADPRHPFYCPAHAKAAVQKKSASSAKSDPNAKLNAEAAFVKRRWAA